MEIQKCNSKNYERLTVFGSIYFDEEFAFFGHPGIILSAFRNVNKRVSDLWKENSITVTIHDQDDYYVSYEYYPEENDFFTVLHELINWMNDLEHGVCCWESYVRDMDNFFPNICKRVSG